jgi:hypothetical protein
MSEITTFDNLIKVYTNKNSHIFKQASEIAIHDIKGKYGFIYDDYDYKGDLVNTWKPLKIENIFINAPRRITVSLDDKILFHKNMKDSIYTPESYLSIDEISDKESLYFVKKTGSTGSKGVNIYNYNDLLKADRDNSVIQKNISNPDLYDEKRYKIRQLVLVYKKRVYIQKNSFITCNNTKYCDSCSENLLRNIHVINPYCNSVLKLSNKLESYDLIFKNITLAVEDFKKCYSDVINNIDNNLYGVLGFDFIVDDKKNVQIIEINHRSNYGHPADVGKECDVGFFKDMFLLLANNINDNFVEV